MKKKNLGFTLAEVLIVIGIIGVVAVLTLPNLNHATGDKETVTRLQKAYSILNEANDRAVAIYGPISTWSEECRNDLNNCWMKRIGEFLKVSKSCDETVDEDDSTYKSCEFLSNGNLTYDSVIYQLPDGITFASDGFSRGCDENNIGHSDLCIGAIQVDVNGPLKGQNDYAKDLFRFVVSDSIGVTSDLSDDNMGYCIRYKSNDCTTWVLEYGNLDYLKADSSGQCNDSNIILDGVTNTSCH